MSATDTSTAERIISARWMLPIAPENRVLDHAGVAIARGRILAVGATADLTGRWPDADHVELGEQVLLPGLVNAHGHAGMSLLRGYGDDLPLQTWLEQCIWPLEGRWVDADFVGDGTDLAIAEMLRGGVTTFADMYFFPERAAVRAERAGLRTQIATPIVMFPTNWAPGPDEAISRTLDLADEYRDHPRVRVAFGPHSTYANELHTLERIGMLAEEIQAPVHMHLHENLAEIQGAMAARGERPLETVERVGLLSPLLQAVHMTQLERADFERLAVHGVSVVHCPQSNMKLASGACPVAGLLAAGVRVALGTDGAASNNALSMLRELHVAALLAKLSAGDAAALPALEALRMATLSGAEALGFGDVAGSLEPGKAADLISIDLSGVAARPVYHPESQLVHAALDDAVTNVWVDGEQLLADRVPTRLDLERIDAAARRWQLRITDWSPS